MSKVTPAIFVLTAIGFWLWPDLPNAEEWGNTPTMTDLTIMFFALLGMIIWEIREAAEWVAKRLEES